MNKVIAIKVDVDTFEGMRKGVPRLLSLFAEHQALASFFVPMGKDHTGWTAKRVFTRKGFLKKAGRVGVLQTYGLKTLMYGLLLKGPEIAAQNAPLLLKIAEEGHEVGVHGLDHVHWHDHIKGLDKLATEGELKKAFAVYLDIFGQAPPSFAAPGWMINAHALAFFEEIGLLYSSDTRGRSPFYPVMGGKRFDILQLPSTLPTLDEAVGLKGADEEALVQYFLSGLTHGLNILTVHAELEGKRWRGFLHTFLGKSLGMGYTFKRLCDVAKDLENGPDPVPSGEIVFGSIEGRAGEVCLQS